MEIRGRGEEGVLDGVQERVTRNDSVLPKSLAGVHSTCGYSLHSHSPILPVYLRGVMSRHRGV